MTRRERLEARVERREEWADKAKVRAVNRLQAMRNLADAIPLGQPILVGHHSERRARRDAERIRSGTEKGLAEARLAEHHASKASGLTQQLDSSIFSDDNDAIKALQGRIKEREAECAHRKEINVAFRKAEGADKFAKLATLVRTGVVTEAEGHDIGRTFGICHWVDRPFPAYSITNLRANIRRDLLRVAEVERRNARVGEAETAGGVAVKDVDCGDNETAYVVVTFVEKPAYAVLGALKAAGFSWGGGSWHGRRDRLPTEVSALVGIRRAPVFPHERFSPPSPPQGASNHD